MEFSKNNSLVSDDHRWFFNLFPISHPESTYPNTFKSIASVFICFFSIMFVKKKKKEDSGCFGHQKQTLYFRDAAKAPIFMFNWLFILSENSENVYYYLPKYSVVLFYLTTSRNPEIFRLLMSAKGKRIQPSQSRLLDYQNCCQLISSRLSIWLIVLGFYN